jgi:hypothetical protein
MSQTRDYGPDGALLTSPILSCLCCWVSFEDCLGCLGYRSAALRDQWQLLALGEEAAWQCTQDWCRTASCPRPTIVPTNPDTRGFGSFYRVRFAPFLFPVSCLAFFTNTISQARRSAAKVLTRDEARRIAANIATRRRCAALDHEATSLADARVPLTLLGKMENLGKYGKVELYLRRHFG